MDVYLALRLSAVGWGIGNRKRRKSILVGRNSMPQAGLLAMAHFLPRLTPWAALIRHGVADGLQP